MFHENLNGSSCKLGGAFPARGVDILRHLAARGVHLPEPGEVFEYDGFTVQVLEVDEQRVTRLRVTFDRSRSSMEAKDNDD